VTPPLGAEHVTIAVSGAHGGHTVDFRALAASGIVLLGRAVGFAGGTMRFAADLGQTIADGDASYLALLDEADAYVERNGLDLPEEPDARALGLDPDCVTNPVRDVDLARAGVGSIVGEMPRRGSPYVERPLTVESLAELRSALQEAADGWADLTVALSTESMERVSAAATSDLPGQRSS
jgi:hypothetical protein